MTYRVRRYRGGKTPVDYGEHEERAAADAQAQRVAEALFGRKHSTVFVEPLEGEARHA